MAFLRAFAGWEAFLEAVFIRSVCGYKFAAGQEALVAGRTYFRSIPVAEAVLMPAKRPYMLWHKPTTVIARYDSYFSYAPGAPAVQRSVIASA